MKYTTTTNDPMLLAAIEKYKALYTKWEYTRALMPDAKFDSVEWTTFTDRLATTEKLLREAEQQVCWTLVNSLEVSSP